jgi:DNA-binding MarR family transcriptional regulator
MAVAARKGRGGATLGQADYEALAAFRQALRGFFRFSDEAARSAGLLPRQYQALLAVRGQPAGRPIGLGELAAQLGIRHHSAVGLVDRMAGLGLVARRVDPEDRRRVSVTLTASGERTLARLASAHRAELRGLAPRLRALLARLLRPR